MTATKYEMSVRFSEQEVTSSPRVRLMDQVRRRDVVQNAMAQIIQNYERTSGLSVVRIEWDRKNRKVILEALPL